MAPVSKIGALSGVLWSTCSDIVDGRLECICSLSERMGCKMFNGWFCSSICTVDRTHVFLPCSCFWGFDSARGVPLNFTLAFEVVVGAEEDVELEFSCWSSSWRVASLCPNAPHWRHFPVLGGCMKVRSSPLSSILEVIGADWFAISWCLTLSFSYSFPILRLTLSRSFCHAGAAVWWVCSFLSSPRHPAPERVRQVLSPTSPLFATKFRLYKGSRSPTWVARQSCATSGRTQCRGWPPKRSKSSRKKRIFQRLRVAA